MRRLVLVGAALAALGWWLATPRAVVLESAIADTYPLSSAVELSLDVPPHQERLSRSGGYEADGFRLTPRATFQLEAYVLGRRDYRFGREARISPTDLALGWGPMADPDVLEHVDVWQRGRFYYWRSRNLPVPAQEIQNSSSNMHLIPGNPDAAADLRRVRRGDTVRIRGHLVDVDADRWYWRTSLRRTDSGAGACEIVLVDSLEIL